MNKGPANNAKYLAQVSNRYQKVSVICELISL